MWGGAKSVESSAKGVGSAKRECGGTGSPEEESAKVLGVRREGERRVWRCWGVLRKGVGEC